MGFRGAVGLGVALVAAIVLAPIGSSGAADVDELIDIARGGALYDNWYAALEKVAPLTVQPSYPAAGTQTGAVTWRCKECHGWDYRGAEGAYGTGSHSTGIKGIAGAAGKDPAAIALILRDRTHGYSQEMLSNSAVAKLALFVSRGQVDMNQYIDRATGNALGNSGRGVPLYRMACYACHGPDGRRFNFGSDTDPEYLGTLARENPWEVLHRIRFGLPGVGMPALVLSTLSESDQADILAYAQTLPAK